MRRHIPFLHGGPRCRPPGEQFNCFRATSQIG